MSTLLQDVRYAIRMLAKSPGFTAVAVIALALGIGANTVMFSSVNGMLLHPFLFKDLHRIVDVWETAPKQNEYHIKAAPANLRDWQEQNKGFEMLAASHGWNVNLTGVGVAERVEGYQVTSGFFSLLGMPPQFGRAITQRILSPATLPSWFSATAFGNGILELTRASSARACT